MQRLTTLFLLHASATLLPAQETTFAIIGDFGLDNMLERDVADLVSSWSPDFVITTGDNNYRAPGNAVTDFGEWDQAIGAYYGEFLLGRTDGRYPNQTSTTQRFFPVIGNHDTGTGTSNQGNSGGTALPYLDYFHHDPNRPQGRLPVGSGRHDPFATYYDFIIDDIHFFMMDTEHAIDNPSLLAEQADWLQAGLQDSEATWKFVVTHFAPYTSAIKGLMPYVQFPYQRWGAHGVFAGDNHVYERMRITDDLNNQMLYLINGTSGNSLLHPFEEPIPGSAARIANWGAVRVTTDASTATFEFIKLDGVVQDSFVLRQDDLPPTPAVVGTALAPRVDTYIDSRLPGDSFVDDVFSRVQSGATTRQGLMRFDLPESIRDAFENTSNARAFLELTPESVGDLLALHRVTTDWLGLDRITWNSIGATGNGFTPGDDVLLEPTDVIRMPTKGRPLRFDVTADVEAWISGADNFGWAILSDDSGTTVLRTDEGVARAPRLLLVEDVGDEQFDDLHPTLAGDYNLNGRRDDDDITSLCEGFGSNRSLFDLNEDAVVDATDLAAWLDLTGVSVGNTDFERDHDVDAADRLTLVANWTGAGGHAATWSMGDFDCDGDVDAADQNGLVTNWTGAIAAPEVIPVSIPEPGSWQTISLGLLLLLPRRSAINTTQRINAVRRSVSSRINNEFGNA